MKDKEKQSKEGENFSEHKEEFDVVMKALLGLKPKKNETAEDKKSSPAASRAKT